MLKCWSFIQYFATIGQTRTRHTTGPIIATKMYSSINIRHYWWTSHTANTTKTFIYIMAYKPDNTAEVEIISCIIQQM